MLEQKRLGNDGTGTARSEQASQDSDEMDERTTRSRITELVTFRRVTLPQIHCSPLLMCPTHSLLDIRRSD
jgi:hypothetical protein